VSDLYGSDLKDSVAAHQAVCLCHPGIRSVCDTMDCPGSTPALVVRDSASREWHIDPLCKMRSEAKA